MTILVTGGSGYIALHCIAELLKNGFYVRTSLRTIDRKKEVVNSLQKVVNPKDMLEFCILDLMEDKGWDKAVQGCTYVMHIASPVLSKGDDENKELIQKKESLEQEKKIISKKKKRESIFKIKINFKRN